MKEPVEPDLDGAGEVSRQSAGHVAVEADDVEGGAYGGGGMLCADVAAGSDDQKGEGEREDRAEGDQLSE
jgi:hypothetical protein